MGCCFGSSALPVEQGPGTVVVEPIRSLHGQPVVTSIDQLSDDGQQQAGGRTVNHFLASVRRNGFDSVPVPLFHAYSRHLGIDPEEEEELLWIAELAALAPMPMGWTEHCDAQGRAFYYNADQRTSWWTHPLEDEHRVVYQRITAFRDRASGGDELGLKGLRAELWQAEADAVEAEQGWAEFNDQDDRQFFFNRNERLSSWTDPRPAIRHRLLVCQRAMQCVLGYPQEVEEEEGPPSEVEADRPHWLEEYEKHCRGTDTQSSPRLLSMEGAAECPVCYDPLCTSRPSVLVSVAGQRICGHYFCLTCARRLRSGCPLCRARPAAGGLARAVPLPDIEKRPLQWFSMVDVNGDGHLELAETVKALEAVLPLDAERLSRALGSSHQKEDGDGFTDMVHSIPGCNKVFGVSDGCTQFNGAVELTGLGAACGDVWGVRGGLEGDCSVISSPMEKDATSTFTSVALSRQNADISLAGCSSGRWREWEEHNGNMKGSGINAEAFCADGGMLQWIVKSLDELRHPEASEEPPPLQWDGLEKWFDFWSAHAEGGLSKSELLRALMKTLRVTAVQRRRVSDIRKIIETCFHSWAKQNEERISREEFLAKPNGLGELLLGALFPSCQEEEEAPVVAPSPPTSPRAPPPQAQDERRTSFDSEDGTCGEEIIRVAEHKSAALP
eukprot:TRINITY_DN10452_c0_g1_i2.p1 TRINITY_DN10452_c0_g1~~TRINITY_DN10452_c0_g1_i2.p1  ORF type:complete len:670 (+),score=98.82 TRINITY_DN10452_c0_g1_i2:85-2094(+)